VGRSRGEGGVDGVGKSLLGCGAGWSILLRRAVGGGVAGIIKSRVKDDARQSAAQRHGVGGRMVEEEV
jgi:hypothetical protein